MLIDINNWVIRTSQPSVSFLATNSAFPSCGRSMIGIVGLGSSVCRTITGQILINHSATLVPLEEDTRIDRFGTDEERSAFVFAFLPHHQPEIRN